MTEGLRSIRPLGQESLRGVEMVPVGKRPPKFEWVDPKTLYVEDSHQRTMDGENSTKLVRKIVGRFNWARFKPPICVRLPESGNVLVCIDGQHTATAAATRPDIDKIPVMVVTADDVAARASAFVGHNRDRLALTQMAVYHAELASGDPVAIMVDKACKMAGARILIRPVNLSRPTTPGDTIAVGTIRALARSHGIDVLARVLGILVRAGRGPIKADEIAAVAILTVDREESATLDLRLAKLIESRTAERWKASAASLAADTGESVPSALALEWHSTLGLPGSPVRKKNAFGAANAIPARAKAAVERPPAQQKPPPAPVPPPPAATKAPVPATKAPPAATPPRPASAPPAVAIVQRNGIILDVQTGHLAHRGQTVRVHREDGVRLVAALVRVMPAMLDTSRLVSQAFGGPSADGAARLKGLIDDLNPALQRARLEIKTVAKMGNTIFDLGP